MLQAQSCVGNVLQTPICQITQTDHPTVVQTGRAISMINTAVNFVCRENVDGTLVTFVIKSINISLSLSLSGACQEDVAASTSVRHAGLSGRPRPFSARFAWVFRFCVASLWEDPECRLEELGNGLDWHPCSNYIPDLIHDLLFLPISTIESRV